MSPVAEMTLPKVLIQEASVNALLRRQIIDVFGGIPVDPIVFNKLEL